MNGAKRFLLVMLVSGALVLPGMVLAHGGVDDGHDEDAATGSANAVTQELKSEGFALSSPLSPKWWMLVGSSLILMGLLSIRVQKYLEVPDRP